MRARPKSIIIFIRQALQVLPLFFGLWACHDPRLGFEARVIETLNRSILAIEDAGDNSNMAFVDGWITRHQMEFTFSIQKARNELHQLIERDAEGRWIHCRLPDLPEGAEDGCLLIQEASLKLMEMRVSGDRVFHELRWGHLKQASEAMARGDDAAADARRTLYQAQDYYIQRMQANIVRSSNRILQLAGLVILILLTSLIFCLHLILQSKAQQQLLLEREQTNREYTRKLEWIGREVRRLRDLGAAIDATAGVLVFNELHRVISVNEGFRKLRGLEKTEVAGQDIVSVLGIEDAERIGTIISSIEDKGIWRGEMEGRRADGTVVWMFVLFYPELDDLEDFEGSLALVLDITENKNAQLTLDRTRHLAALGEMAGGIAHELNNPLSVMTGRVAVLLKKLQAHNLEPETLQAGLEQIQKTVNRITRIVDSVRRLSRPDANTEAPRPATLEAILKEMQEFTEDRLKKFEVALSLHDREGLGGAQVLLQGFGISQILINLISNAADAIHSASPRDRWIRVELVRGAPGLVQIKVVDSGPGIPEAIRDRIMHPFFTTKPAGQGTGLGLSLSLRIAAEHGGRLYLDGAAVPTTFVLELPELKQSRNAA